MKRNGNRNVYIFKDSSQIFNDKSTLRPDFDHEWKLGEKIHSLTSLHTLAKSFVDQRFGQIYFKMTSFSQFPMVKNCLMHKRLIAIVKLIKQ